ncbi:MAG: formylglycine-generating enzyme family protein [Armatimonadetes bacterium]|nr:formylglycine-generating enzyme family protein [Armatimonadota bacterium]
MRTNGAWLIATAVAGLVLTGCPRPQAPTATGGGAAAKGRVIPKPTEETTASVELPEGCSTSPDNEAQPGEAGYRMVHDGSGIEFVWAPGGSFTMGTSKEELTALWKEWGPAYNSMPHEGPEEDLQSFWRETANTEAPEHEVELDGFWIARTEVTIGQWRKVMGSVPRQEYVSKAEHPVTSITYRDCEAFCEKLGFALPTEAQWEYAARGAEGLQYPWGNDWDAGKCQCYVGGHEYEYSAPAGHMKDDVSWCGALDMAGNVSEWCRDWFGNDTTLGEGRVVRGGSWESEALDCRGASRHYEYPDSGYYLYGVRPVIELE